MVVKHRSYYSMTDIQAEVMFRTKKYSTVLFGFLGGFGFFYIVLGLYCTIDARFIWQIMICMMSRLKNSEST